MSAGLWSLHPPVFFYLAKIFTPAVVDNGKDNVYGYNQNNDDSNDTEPCRRKDHPYNTASMKQLAAVYRFAGDKVNSSELLVGVA